MNNCSKSQNKTRILLQLHLMFKSIQESEHLYILTKTTSMEGRECLQMWAVLVNEWKHQRKWTCKQIGGSEIKTMKYSVKGTLCIKKRNKSQVHDWICNYFCDPTTNSEWNAIIGDFYGCNKTLEFNINYKSDPKKRIEAVLNIKTTLSDRQIKNNVVYYNKLLHRLSDYNAYIYSQNHHNKQNESIQTELKKMQWCKELETLLLTKQYKPAMRLLNSDENSKIATYYKNIYGIIIRQCLYNRYNVDGNQENLQKIYTEMMQLLGATYLVTSDCDPMLYCLFADCLLNYKQNQNKKNKNESKKGRNHITALNMIKATCTAASCDNICDMFEIYGKLRVCEMLLKQRENYKELNEANVIELIVSNIDHIYQIFDVQKAKLKSIHVWFCREVDDFYNSWRSQRKVLLKKENSNLTKRGKRKLNDKVSGNTRKKKRLRLTPKRKKRKSQIVDVRVSDKHFPMICKKCGVKREEFAAPMTKWENHVLRLNHKYKCPFDCDLSFASTKKLCDHKKTHT